MISRATLASAAIFLVAFGVRGTQLARMSEHDVLSGPLRDGGVVSLDEGINIANALVQRGEYADPFFNHPTGVTAHCPPAFPLVTAAIFEVFGTAEAGQVARDLWNIAGYSLLFALFPWAAFRLGMTRMPGWIAGGVAATYTLYGPSEISWGRDEWLAALGLMLLTVFAWRLAQREELPARSLLGFGAGWGGLMYVQPATLLVLPLHLGIVLWARRRPIAVRVNRAGLFFAAFLLAVAPWTVRNRMAMGSWFFMRDNAGLEMEASNGDGALAAFEANVNGPWFCSVHPDCFEGASVEIREVGEVEFNRRAMRKAVVWIEENPGYFAALSARRAMYFWFDLPARGMRFYIRGAMALLGLAGLWLMWRRGLRVQAALFAAVWAAYPLTFYVVQYMDRYASPIAAAVLLPAGFAIEALAGRRVTTPDRVGSG